MGVLRKELFIVANWEHQPCKSNVLNSCLIENAFFTLPVKNIILLSTES